MAHTRTDSNGQSIDLPLAERSKSLGHDISIKYPSTEVRDIFVDSNNLKNFPYRDFANRYNAEVLNVALGDVVELNGFVQDREAPVDFMPKLLSMAERFGITSLGRVLTQKEVQELPKVSGIANYDDYIRYNERMKSYDIRASFFRYLKHALPTAYYLECDNIMRRYYLSLTHGTDPSVGFHDFGQFGDNYVLTASREELEKIVGDLHFRDVGKPKLYMDPLPYDWSLKTTEISSYLEQKKNKLPIGCQSIFGI